MSVDQKKVYLEKYEMMKKKDQQNPINGSQVSSGPRPQNQTQQQKSSNLGMNSQPNQ